MTDEQLARALHSAGLLDLPALKNANAQRGRGESLAKTILRLGLVPPGEILALDPDALGPSLEARPEIGAPIQNAKNTSESEMFAAPAPVSTDDPTPFWIEGGGENGTPDPMQGTVVHIVNHILKTAIRTGASDIHFEPKNRGLLVRFRLEGELHARETLPLDVALPTLSRLKVVANLDITEMRIPQDGRFRAHYGEKTLDFRVSTLPGIHGEKIVLRVLDHSSLVTDLHKLGFSTRDKERFEELLRRNHGMILVTGPTGSGKTTTLYAALAATSDATKNVITVEDPVEYELASVNQTNINSEIGLTFASALRAILRQDPDVILVGEIRDEETADIAVRAALTGHLLLSTLHTNSAVETITRLSDMHVPHYLLSSSLAGILAQRLSRMICRGCRQPIPGNYPAREEWAEFFNIPANAVLHHGVGCERCNNTGKRGRVAILELLSVTPKLRRAIAGGADSETLRQIAREDGFRTLRDDAREKVLAGFLAPEEAMSTLAGQDG